MKLIPRPCPICGTIGRSMILQKSNFDPSRMNEYSFSSRKLPEFMHFRMIICPECDLCYANPVPELSWFCNEYKEASFDAADESKYAAKQYANCLEKHVGSLAELDGALDIGAGDGAFLKELLNLGLTMVQGVEPSKAPIARADSRVAPLIQNSFFEPDMFSPESFNLVSCFQTIEHLPDPKVLFTSAFKMLRPGGCFFIVAHNYRSFSARLLGAKSPIFDIEHLQVLSSLSTKALYQRAGFTSVSIFPILNRYPLSYWLRLSPFSERFKRGAGRLTNAIGAAKLTVSLPAGNIAAFGFKHQ